jgi:UDP-glucose:(heptosyl)LPS alpha-1,3-glucosyltransferase
MRLAFCLYKYFPFGGLQRDFLRIAKACLAKGHQVDVYTMAWEGPKERDLSIHVLPIKQGWNHHRCQQFVKQLEPLLKQGHYDLVVGFNKMPGLDVYYAADICYQARAYQQRSWWYRLTRRYRHYVAYEEAVFTPNTQTHILLLSSRQQIEFSQYYHTPADRLHLLPPGIAQDRMAPAHADQIRLAVRQEYGIGEDEFLLLMVGSGFRTKGVDRTVLAYAALPAELKQRTRVLIIGKDNPRVFQALARKHGVENKIVFLGGREDVPRFLLAADVLLHPAYNENTGTVLLEALAAGLPVLTNDVCGYACYVQEAHAGVVLTSPFQQDALNAALTTMLLSTDRESWRDHAIQFSKKADIYSMPERATQMIELFGSLKT